MEALYALPEEIDQLRSHLEEMAEDENPSDESVAGTWLEQQIDLAERPAPEQLEDVLRWYRNVQAGHAALEAEVARLTARMKAKETEMERIKSLMEFLLRKSKSRKLSTPLGTVFKRAGSPRLEVDESRILEWPQQVFDACCEVRYSVRKTELKLVKDYQNLPGVSEVMGKAAIVVK